MSESLLTPRYSSSAMIDLFLAGSPTELISGLACISQIRPARPVFLLERNSTACDSAFEQLIEAAKLRFQEAEFRSFRLDRKGLGQNRHGQWDALSRIRYTRQLRQRIDASIRQSFGVGLDQLHGQIHAVYFTYLGDYAKILLEALRKRPRFFYPHGFDHPRSEQIRDLPFLFQQRGLRTALRSLPHLKSIAGWGEIGLSAMMRAVGLSGTCLPYEGTDAVYSFRRLPLITETPLRRVGTLRETFEWLTGIRPWADALQEARSWLTDRPVMLLLSEYDRHPIWEENLHWEDAHLRLAQATLRHTGSSALVIKAHPRSDGLGAARLQDRIHREHPSINCRILPTSLSTLPVEALALALEFVAACSIGSCSLPSDIGIDVPHFTDVEISAYFDHGWHGTPFWASYADLSQMLVDEGICQPLPPSPA
jgi:hypothetical protein